MKELTWKSSSVRENNGDVWERHRCLLDDELVCLVKQGPWWGRSSIYTVESSTRFESAGLKFQSQDLVIIKSLVERAVQEYLS